MKFLIKANVPHRFKKQINLEEGDGEIVPFSPDGYPPLKASLAYYVHNFCLEL